MKTRTSFILLIFFLFLVGCAKAEEDIGPVIKGKIEQIEGNTFLVVEEGRPESEEIWFTAEKMDTLFVGRTVSVWSTDLYVENGVTKGTAYKIK